MEYKVTVVVKGGLLQDRLQSWLEDTNFPKISYINETTGVIENGKRFMLKGIVRGADSTPLTYYADSIENFTDAGMALLEWIYYIKEVNKCHTKN
jgi:hypothetical protein